MDWRAVEVENHRFSGSKNWWKTDEWMLDDGWMISPPKLVWFKRHFSRLHVSHPILASGCWIDLDRAEGCVWWGLALGCQMLQLPRWTCHSSSVLITMNSKARSHQKKIPRHVAKHIIGRNASCQLHFSMTAYQTLDGPANILQPSWGCCAASQVAPLQRWSMPPAKWAGGSCDWKFGIWWFR